MFGFRLFEEKELYVRRKDSEIEPQEVILDALAAKGEQDGISHQRMELPLPQGVLRAFYGVFLLIVFLFLVKSFEFQAISGDSWSVLAQKNVTRESPIAPERGIIYDRNFVQLVSNEPSFDFACDKRDMPSQTEELKRVLRNAAEITHKDFEDVRKSFDETQSPEVLVAEDLSQEELVVSGARAGDIQGCVVQENTKRKYAQGRLFSHMIGYVAKISQKDLEERQGYTPLDKIGKDGVENAYEEQLRGIPGASIMEKDAYGKQVSSIKERDPISGFNLVLYADSKLQGKLLQFLHQALDSIGAKKAAAVALDPETGGVLAMASLPGFDANQFSEGISSKEWNSLLEDPSKPLFNRAIGGIGFPTGSVIKPIIALAGLQENVITERTTLFAPLELCVDNIYTREPECFSDWTFHGDTDVKRALAESVNPFFYIIGGGFEGFKGLGPLKIVEYLERFGWGSQTGIDIPGEGAGILPEIDKNWRLGDTYHLAIGQGAFAATPLQVASAISAIANGGKLLEPQIAQSIVDSKRNVIQEFNPVVLKDSIADSKNIEIVRKGMRQTVTAGSATGWLNQVPVKVAAKTGTAQTGRKTADGKDFLFSWTAAFAPYDNPEIAIVVVVEGVREGQVASLPVVRDTLQWYFTK